MGTEVLIICVSFLISSYITADRVPATRPAVRKATAHGGRAVVRTARQTWGKRRAARRKAFADWWAKTKVRRGASKVLKLAGRGVTSVGAFGRDVVVVGVLAGAAGVTEAVDGWRTGREEYRKSKEDSAKATASDGSDEEGSKGADSAVPQPRTAEEATADSTPGQQGGQQGGQHVGPQQAAGATAAGTAPAAGGTATMTTQAGEQVDLTGVINWCDGAFSSADGSETVGYVNSGTQLYESFGGAIADIGGQVAEAATAEQETATAARDALAAWGEAVLHLKERCKAAIGG